MGSMEFILIEISTNKNFTKINIKRVFINKHLIFRISKTCDTYVPKINNGFFVNGIWHYIKWGIYSPKLIKWPIKEGIWLIMN